MNTDRFVGCLLGGAVGDALGAPVEFMKRSEILRRFGPEGITQYAQAYGRLGAITDDTQMTLFTAEGLIRSHVRWCCRGICFIPSVVANAYERWLVTQGEHQENPEAFHGEPDGWLFRQRALHSTRAPGNTCLSALRTMSHCGAVASNDSKGCGAVMRSAPVGLFGCYRGQGTAHGDVFQLAVELAALTHGHPTGQLTAGCLAVMIMDLAMGVEPREALRSTLSLLRTQPHHDETLRALTLAEKLANSQLAPHKAIAQIGAGWIAEEALAISIYCALVARNFREGVSIAINHDGDSDSTGSITGNLLGVLHGTSAIPAELLEPLELREVITELATDLHDFVGWNIGDMGDRDETARVFAKYPGW